MALADVPADMFTETNSCLHLRGKMSGNTRWVRTDIQTDSAKILSSDVNLQQGPFTLEAWIYAEDISRSRAVVAKTQSSEYAIFLHDGFPQFDVHLAGSYVSPKSDTKVDLRKWTHLAGVFDGQECRLYVDGKLTKTLTGKGARDTNQLPLFVGADPDGFGNPTREFAGKIDDVRLSTGVRYTGDFTPSRRHQTDPSTVLLLNFDRQIGPFALDASPNRTSVILLGDAKVQQQHP